MKEKENTKIIVKKEGKGNQRLDYFGALKGIGEFTEEDKFKGQFDE